MKHLRRLVTFSLAMLLLGVMPVVANAQMSKVKTVFILLMENHNWTGNNSGAAFGDPDLKGSSEAPYINSLIPLRARAEQYFNPPGNHPSNPNYLWLEAGTNFGKLNDNLPKQKNITSTKHLVTLLENASPAITWKAYVEPEPGNSDFTDCPLNFNEVDVNHLPFDYFSNTTNGFKSTSAHCIAHVKPYDQLQGDLNSGVSCTKEGQTNCVAQYNFITPNTCDQGHESSCQKDDTKIGDTWLKNNVPDILNSTIYQTEGALFIVWDEAEDSGSFSDGPIGMFVLSPFAKTNYSNTIHYDHSSMLKTVQEIFGVTPLLGAAANKSTKDLSDFFLRADLDDERSRLPASRHIRGR